MAPPPYDSLRLAGCGALVKTEGERRMPLPLAIHHNPATAGTSARSLRAIAPLLQALRQTPQP